MTGLTIARKARFVVHTAGPSDHTKAAETRTEGRNL